MFLSFHDDAASGSSAHTLGPYEDVVIRGARVVGETHGQSQLLAFRGSDGRWLDAERERRRDIASDVPFARHAYLRLQSIEPALMIRFFGEDSDDSAVRARAEAGPFSAIVIGLTDLHADGVLVARRASAAAPWAPRGALEQNDQPRAGAVLGVRSGKVIRPSEDARMGPAPKIVPTSFGPAFQFVERARVA